MLQQNENAKYLEVPTLPLYHAGGISLHVSLSVNWSDIIQICEKIKNKKTFIIQLCQVFALWKIPALYPLGVFVVKKMLWKLMRNYVTDTR